MERRLSSPPPADNQLTPERVRLGRKLFFDPLLSIWVRFFRRESSGDPSLARGLPFASKQRQRPTQKILVAPILVVSDFTTDGEMRHIESRFESTAYRRLYA